MANYRYGEKLIVKRGSDNVSRLVPRLEKNKFYFACGFEPPRVFRVRELQRGKVILYDTMLGEDVLLDSSELKEPDSARNLELITQERIKDGNLRYSRHSWMSSRYLWVGGLMTWHTTSIQGTDVQNHPFDLTSAGFKRDPFPTLRAMRQVSPIVRTKMPFVGNVWVTTTYASTSEVLRSKEIFVTNPRNAGRRGMAGFRWWMPSTLRAITSNMLGKDEPDHRRSTQRLWRLLFSGKASRAMQTKISHSRDYTTQHVGTTGHRSTTMGRLT